MTRVNIEAIRLYRDILRTSRMFTWNNEKNELWSKVLKQNARKEFEQARYESDPMVVTRLLVVGRDALNQTNEKLIQTATSIKDNVDRSRRF